MFGKIPKRLENKVLKRYLYTHVHCIFTVTKVWKQPKCPLTDEWIEKMWTTYTMEYYLVLKKKESCQML